MAFGRFGTLGSGFGRLGTPGVGVRGPRIVLSASSVAEDASVGTAIGTLSVINGSGSYTFSITADPDSKFAINVDGVTLETADTLDYDTDTSHSVTIEADNGVDTPITRTFTISITNVLEVTLSGLTLDDTTADVGVAWSATISGKSSGSTITATSSDGTVLSVVGTTVSGTFSAAGTPDVTLTETHADGSNSPRNSVIAVTVSEVSLPPEAPLATLVSDSSDDTPDWDIDLPSGFGDGRDAQVGDILIGRYQATGGDWSSATTYVSDTLDSSEIAADTISETASAIPAGTYDWQWGLQRDGVVENWYDAGTHTIDSAVFDPAALLVGKKGFLFDAAQEAYTDAGTTLATTNGQTIQQINDLGPNGHNLSQATAGSRPFYVVDGALRYLDGAASRDMTASGVDLSGGKYLTVVIGLRQKKDSGFTQAYVEMGDGSASLANPSARLGQSASTPNLDCWTHGDAGNSLTRGSNNTLIDGSSSNYVPFVVTAIHTVETAVDNSMRVNGASFGSMLFNDGNTNANFGASRTLTFLADAAKSIPSDAQIAFMFCINDTAPLALADIQDLEQHAASLCGASF